MTYFFHFACDGSTYYYVFDLLGHTNLGKINHMVNIGFYKKAFWISYLIETKFKYIQKKSLMDRVVHK